MDKESKEGLELARAYTSVPFTLLGAWFLYLGVGFYLDVSITSAGKEVTNDVPQFWVILTFWLILAQIA